MKIAFPTNKLQFYPVRPGERFDAATAGRLFAWGSKAGFDGVELEESKFAMAAMSTAELDGLGEQLKSAGLEAAAVKTGGDLYTPAVAARNEQAMLDGIRVAAHLGAKITSISLGTPATYLGVGNHERLGGRICFGGSALASEHAYATTAAALRRVAEAAATAGIALSLEICPSSITDNSASALKLLVMVDHPALGVNPDLGNIITAYMEPEEDWRDCLIAVAPHLNHLHVKNVCGIRIPEFQRTVFKRGALWDGVIDLRYLLSWLREISYAGYCVIESAGTGDMPFNFEQGLHYIRKLQDEI